MPSTSAAGASSRPIPASALHRIFHQHGVLWAQIGFGGLILGVYWRDMGYLSLFAVAALLFGLAAMTWLHLAAPGLTRLTGRGGWLRALAWTGAHVWVLIPSWHLSDGAMAPVLVAVAIGGMALGRGLDEGVARPWCLAFYLALGTLALLTAGGVSWSERLVPAAGMVIVFWLVVGRELTLLRALDTHATDAGSQAGLISRIEGMTRDAELGGQFRVMAHEVSNLITILDLSTSTHSNIDLERIRRSIHFLKRINRLVLHDLAKGDLRQKVRLGDVLSDVELLLRKEVTRHGISFELMLEDGVADEILEERSGSLVLIIRNLVKNALDAIIEKNGTNPGGGCVLLTAARWDKGILISVADSGTGMPETDLETIARGAVASHKPGGHGIGLRFVFDECRRNGFELDMASIAGAGTTVTVSVTKPASGGFVQAPGHSTH